MMPVRRGRRTLIDDSRIFHQRAGRCGAMIVAAVPAHNEEKTIAKVLVGAFRQVDRVLVVDDGSSDATAEIAEKLGAVVIKHGRNFGKGKTIRTMFDWARTNQVDVLVTLDADGQHIPDDIPKVLRPVIEGKADISIGSRFLEQASSTSQEMPMYRQWGAKVIGGVVRSLSGLPIRDTESGFRAYDQKALLALRPSEMGMGAEASLLLQASEKGLAIAEVSINVAYKGLRGPRHNPMYHALDVLASIMKFVSIRHPLPFYGVPGLVALMIGLFLGLQAFNLYSRYSIFPTNLGIVAVGASLTGILLLSIGIILFTLITVLRERG
jgi:glycosyltransferase involved in cell wall biosynthesis